MNNKTSGLPQSLIFSKNEFFNYGIVFYGLFPTVFAYLFTILNVPIPANATLYVIIILLALIGSDFFSKIRKISFSFFIYSFFIVWLLAGYFYSPSKFARDEKILIIFYNIISPSIIFVLYFFSNNIKIDYNHLKNLLLKFSYIITYVILLFFIFSSKIDETGRYSIPGSENPIYLARFLCVLNIIILYINHKTIPYFFKFITIFVLLILIFLSASKGPLLALLITAFIIFKRKYNISNLKLVLVFGFFLFLLYLGYFFSEKNYLFDTNFYSSYARLDLLVQIQKNLNMNYFFGAGMASFNYLYFDVDSFGYPHNLLVEVFLENGIVGLVLLLTLIFYFFRYFEVNIFSLLVIFYFICAQTSGDVSFNGQFFIYLLFYFLYKISIEKTIKFSRV